MWATTNPRFHFRQCFPLQLTPALLTKLCNNLCIVEVWNHVPIKATLSLHDPNSATHDQASTTDVHMCSRVTVSMHSQHTYTHHHMHTYQLVGLVKLSMHQFFLAYRKPASVSISTQTKVSQPSSHPSSSRAVTPNDVMYYELSLSLSLSLIPAPLQLPVVSVDAYCPIVEPITGEISGHLGVLLAMGTPDQVCTHAVLSQVSSFLSCFALHA